MRLKNFLPALALLLAAFSAPTVLRAQTVEPTSRITAELSDASKARLAGSLHPLAQPGYSTGRVSGGTQMNGITMVFQRSAAQQAELEALIASQQNPASPLFHQWLNPDQFAARFGMSTADLAKVQSWLEQHGFRVDSVARSRTYLTFSGTAAQVEQAFSTEMHTYAVPFNGTLEHHIAPATELSLPAGLAPVVSAVRNLDDFHPHPMKKAVPAEIATPAFTSATSGNHFVSPGDIDVIYDINALHNAGYTGTGQTIAIMGQSNVNVADVTNFQTAAGLTAKAPTLLLVPNSGTAYYSSGDEGESDLDLEWSSAIAPGASILFVYTGNNTTYSVFDSLQYTVDNKLAQIISFSYGTCESNITPADVTAIEAVNQQAESQGQSFLVASGDQGSTACATTTAGSKALAVSYPASSPLATAVGGTEFNEGSGSYWQSASGTDVITSAISYIPEMVWNDDSSSGLAASGGGVSTLFTTKPSWQSGVPGIPSDGVRDVPDISLDASNGHEPYLYCTSDTGSWSTGQVGSCTSGFRDANGTLTVAGGTSFATPIFAGITALINEKTGYSTGQGLLNPTLYTLASNATTYAAAFHDITVGNNKCNAGSTYCTGTIGYSAGTGYDLTTGLGSVDVNVLADAWTTSSSTLIGTTTSLTASNSTPQANTTVTFTLTVASTTGGTIPTGSVNLSLDGTALSAVTLTANGTYAYQTSFASAGSHTLIAAYQGDTTHAASTGTITVTVQGTSSGTGTFAITAPTLTVTDGTVGSSTITVTPASGYKGTVNFTLSTTSSSLTYVCPVISSVTITGTAAVSTTLSMDTNGQNCYATGQKRGAKTTAAIHKSGVGSLAGPISTTLALLSLAMLGLAGRKSARIRALAMLVILAAGGVAMTGCGGGSSSSSGGGTVANPPKGTYQVTITGTDSVTSSITASTTFNLVIQ